MVVFGIDEQWAADLVEVQTLRYNKGSRYLLTVVNVFSKYAWVRRLPYKTGEQVKKAFVDIFKEGCKPLNIQTDDGKEFCNKTVSDLFETHNINHFSTHGDTKSSVVERFKNAFIAFLLPKTHSTTNRPCQW